PGLLSNPSSNPRCFARPPGDPPANLSINALRKTRVYCRKNEHRPPTFLAPPPQTPFGESLFSDFRPRFCPGAPWGGNRGGVPGGAPKGGVTGVGPPG